jgi:hypothetical protein
MEGRTSTNRHFMQQACTQPTKEELLKLLRGNFSNWKVLSVKELEGNILKYYKGAVNPSVIRQLMHEIVMDDNATAI